MGVVPMKEASSFSVHGDVCRTYAVYIYCDNCGSFAIQKRISVRQWLWIIGNCLFGIAILVAARRYALDPVVWVALLGCLMLLALLAYAYWEPSAYRCKKCGEFTTIRYNTRDYPSDPSIVDVSEQHIQQFGLMGWPDDQPIEAYLSPHGDARWK